MKSNFTRSISILLLGVFSLGTINSCKKDFNFESSSNYNSNFSHKISQADIQKWAVENPVVKYLALDYKNAKQTLFRGRMVVKIPVLNENIWPCSANNTGVSGSSSGAANLARGLIK